MVSEARVVGDWVALPEIVPGPPEYILQSNRLKKTDWDETNEENIWDMKFQI
jgi:hypothetical protein